jgi:ribonuclease BN (tRNA processing enzyme)
MKLEIIPLGTNGFFPSGGRHTMSFLLLGGPLPLLLDAGTGISRLIEPHLQRRLAGAEEIHILLTHYHLDHVVGLSYLPAVCRQGRVVLHAPKPPLVDGDPSALERLIAPPLFPVPLRKLVAEVVVEAYDDGIQQVAGLSIRVRRQSHAGGSVGVVLGGRLAYLTDCDADEASAPFARGATTLIHEAWTTDAEVAAGTPRHGHSTVEQVAYVARESGVEQVVPVHHRPGRSEQELEAMEARIAELSGVTVVRAAEGEAILV